MSDMDLKKIKKVHFIGIGGIGVSALARMMLHEGKIVTGSDSGSSEITEELKKIGALVFQGHKAEYVSTDVDLVVYTAAIPKDNTELTEAHKRNIPFLSYSEMLGLVSRDKKVIAVSGTHGKTTTTAMIAESLIAGGLKPTVVVGSLLKNPRTNFISGEDEYFLTEADEYKKSFLSLSPFIVVITNIDLDHLDFYKDLADIQDAFSSLVAKIPAEGFLICNMKHPHLAPVIERAKCKVIDYMSADIRGLTLKVPGIHNVENARAALCVGGVLDVSEGSLFRSLGDFEGAWRRFEYKGKTSSGALVYDDYAHNPQKVLAVILGAKEKFPDKKITIVFQPHLYSRTKLLFKEFTESLSKADHIILTPIYSAREVFDPSISSDMLAEEIKKIHKNVISFAGIADIEAYIKKTLTEVDVCLVVGAGDIYHVAQHVVV